ncbi:Mitochondrial carrier protein [Plasmodiophora brassicae]
MPTQQQQQQQQQAQGDRATAGLGACFDRAASEMAGESIDDVCWRHMDLRRYLVFNTVFILAHDSVLHPFEVIKVRQQHYRGTGMPLDAWTSARVLLKREGVQGLFRGLMPSTVGNLPGQLIYFGVYEYLKQMLMNADADTTLSKGGVGVIAGFAADTISMVAHTPAEVVSVRMMVSTVKLDYAGANGGARVVVPNARTVFRDVWRSDGIPGLYRGLIGSIASHAPTSAAWFGTYELTKSVLHDERRGTPPLTTFLISGAMAGAASVIVSNPLDVAKTRVQSADLGKPSAGFWTVLYRIVFREGLPGMTKGIGPRMLMQVPGSALTFASYEIVKKLSIKGNIDPIQ